MKIKVVSLMLFRSSMVCFAQDDLKEREKQAAFDAAYSSYSRKKPAYTTLKDGTELEGDIKDVDCKKVQVNELKISADRKKTRILADEIANIYRAPSALEKLAEVVLLNRIT